VVALEAEHTSSLRASEEAARTAEAYAAADKERSLTEQRADLTEAAAVAAQAAVRQTATALAAAARESANTQAALRVRAEAAEERTREAKAQVVALEAEHTSSLRASEEAARTAEAYAAADKERSLTEQRAQLTEAAEAAQAAAAEQQTAAAEVSVAALTAARESAHARAALQGRAEEAEERTREAKARAEAAQPEDWVYSFLVDDPPSSLPSSPPQNAASNRGQNPQQEEHGAVAIAAVHPSSDRVYPTAGEAWRPGQKSQVIGVILDREHSPLHPWKTKGTQKETIPSRRFTTREEAEAYMKRERLGITWRNPFTGHFDLTPNGLLSGTDLANTEVGVQIVNNGMAHLVRRNKLNVIHVLHLGGGDDELKGKIFTEETSSNARTDLVPPFRDFIVKTASQIVERPGNSGEYTKGLLCAHQQCTAPFMQLKQKGEVGWDSFPAQRCDITRAVVAIFTEEGPRYSEDRMAAALVELLSTNVRLIHRHENVRVSGPSHGFHTFEQVKESVLKLYRV